MSLTIIDKDNINIVIEKRENTVASTGPESYSIPYVRLTVNILVNGKIKRLQVTTELEMKPIELDSKKLALHIKDYKEVNVLHDIILQLWYDIEWFYGNLKELIKEL